MDEHWSVLKLVVTNYPPDQIATYLFKKIDNGDARKKSENGKMVMDFSGIVYLLDVSAISLTAEEERKIQWCISDQLANLGNLAWYYQDGYRNLLWTHIKGADKGFLTSGLQIISASNSLLDESGNVRQLNESPAWDLIQTIPELFNGGEFTKSFKAQAVLRDMYGSVLPALKDLVEKIIDSKLHLWTYETSRRPLISLSFLASSELALLSWSEEVIDEINKNRDLEERCAIKPSLQPAPP